MMTKCQINFKISFTFEMCAMACHILHSFSDNLNCHSKWQLSWTAFSTIHLHELFTSSEQMYMKYVFWLRWWHLISHVRLDVFSLGNSNLEWQEWVASANWCAQDGRCLHVINGIWCSCNFTWFAHETNHF